LKNGIGDGGWVRERGRGIGRRLEEKRDVIWFWVQVKEERICSGIAVGMKTWIFRET
jgi:hypothetical protein